MNNILFERVPFLTYWYKIALVCRVYICNLSREKLSYIQSFKEIFGFVFKIKIDSFRETLDPGMESQCS